jgi:hypothetical protein
MSAMLLLLIVGDKKYDINVAFSGIAFTPVFMEISHMI